MPENTMEAFRAAIEDGAGGIETDAHMTRDGHVVLIHDDTVDRTTDGTGAVREMSLDELQTLDSGYWFMDETGVSHRGRGAWVPTLREVYEEFPGVPINIEIKERVPGLEEAVLGEILLAGAEERTLIASSRHGVVERFRRISASRIPTAASRWEIEVFIALHALRLTWLLRPSYIALQVPVEHRGIRIVTPRFIEAAHRLGVRVDVWTIDQPDEMRWLLGLGVDVVMTKRPAVLAEVIRDRMAR
jgi:glycerophosphoryl diester phosphodiesterase